MVMAKNISKKDLLKKPDEFITLSNRTLNWTKENYKTVIGGVSGIIIVLSAYFGYTVYRNNQENVAHEKYFSSQEQGDKAQKLKQLEGVIKGYPGTQGASMAMVSAGNDFYQNKDYAKAIASYQMALDKGNFPQEIVTLIRENLAYAFEEKGDYPSAIKTYTEIAQGKGAFQKEEALISLARVYQKLGKKDEAKKAYQDFIKAYPNSAYANLVRDKISKL
jgi:predicted negative regulator of RcsB-dependent stress response